MWAAGIYAQLKKEKCNSDHIGEFHGRQKLRSTKRKWRIKPHVCIRKSNIICQGVRHSPLAVVIFSQKKISLFMEPLTIHDNAKWMSFVYLQLASPPTGRCFGLKPRLTIVLAVSMTSPPDHRRSRMQLNSILQLLISGY